MSSVSGQSRGHWFFLLFSHSLTHLGVYPSLLILITIPIVLVTVVFGMIPLGDPSNDADVETDWEFAVIKMPLVYFFFTYFHLSIYSWCFGIDHSRIRIIYFIVFALEAVFNFLLFYYSRDIPDLFGLYGLVFFYFVFGVSLYLLHHRRQSLSNVESISEASHINSVDSTVQSMTDVENAGKITKRRVSGDDVVPKYPFFVMMQLMSVVLLYFCIVSGYVVLFREASDDVQNVIIIVLAFVTFLFKKWLLSICDNVVDIEFGMLTAGFWLENLEDLFESLTFPVVKNPESFLLMYFTTLVTNIAYLLFLTKRWFTIRLWIKSHCIFLFTGREHEEDVPIEDDFADDRGHSNIRPGYLRRQLRFFYWKLFSQFVTGLFYLTIASTLRYGINVDYFPFGSDGGYTQSREGLTDIRFFYSLIYAGGSAALALLTFALANAVLQNHFQQVFESIWKHSIHSVLLIQPQYYSYVFAILTSNLFLSVMIIQYHSKIYYGWI